VGFDSLKFNVILSKLTKIVERHYLFIYLKETSLMPRKHLLELIFIKRPVWHVTGTGSGLLGGIPRVVVQISALTLKGPP
jgi:hypothetical protein